MPAGLGGGGSVAFCFEDVNGTYVEPDDAGVQWVPILEEDLKYTEEKYYSKQIRQQTIVSDVQSGYYHVEGTIKMEVDPAFIPYFLHCSRHTIAKSGAGPYTYTYTPSSAGASSTAASGNVARTASITIYRNDVGFGYFGCVVTDWEFMIENGVLVCNMGILGLGEVEPANSPTQAWVAPILYGASRHTVSTGTSATSPTFATVNDFNGFSFKANYNAEPQNRIVNSRAASYISYGETEATIETQLDFIDRTEYDAFVAATQKAFKLESLIGGSSLAAATNGFAIEVQRGSYDQYDVQLREMGGLILADTNIRCIGIAGGDAFKIKVKTAANIA